MTGTTATWQIPYATGSDGLCNGYAIVDSMAARIEALLVSFQADVARVTTIPYASISATVTQTFSTNVAGFASPITVIEYDTVNADTNSYTNLATLPGLLDIPSTGAAGGFFALFLNAMAFTGNPVNTGYVQPIIAVNGSTAGLPGGGSEWADDVNTPVGGTLPKMISTAGTDIQIFSEVAATNSGQPLCTIVSATFFFFWVADQ